MSLVGTRYEKLTVVAMLPFSKVLCRCDCGNERVLRVGHFNAGNAKSCGCHRGLHGHSGKTVKSREYECWSNMKARCHNPHNKRFSDYGGRGILVCERWRGSFSNFLADMGPCPAGYTIDRKDNRLGYFPENCHWVSRSKNQTNRSISKRWTVNGTEYATAREAATASGVSTTTIKAWCEGRTAEGRWYPPKTGCFTRSIYGDERAAA